MSWTDDRVARLSKLWAEGLSASQIAADLGGVTRNAVIGKVHRLGLSGRAKSTNKSASSTRRKAAPRAGGYAKTTTTRPTPRTVGNTALKMDMEVDLDAEVEVELKPQENVVVPISRRLTLMQLTENTCKWPTGDPTMPGFSFCGHTSADEKPYCEYHSKIAFQPANERRRRR